MTRRSDQGVFFRRAGTGGRGRDPLIFRHGGRIAVAGLLVLLMAAVAAALSIVSTDDVVAVNAGLQRARTEVVRMAADLGGLETAELAILVQPEPQRIDRFRMQADEFAERAEKLRSLMVDPDQRSRYDQVTAAATARLADARRRVNEAANGDVTSARADLRAEAVGETEFDKRLESFLAVNSARLQETGRQYSSRLRRQIAVILSAALATLLFGIHQVLSTYRFVREIESSRRGLDAANRELEGEVRARTDELGRVNQLFATALAGSKVTVFSQDANLVYTWIHNPPAHLRAEDIVGKSDDTVTPREWRDSVIAAKKRVLETGRTEVFDISLPASGRDPSWFRMQVDPLYEHGKRSGIVCAAVDISEDRAARRIMRDLAHELAGSVQRFEIALRGAEIFVFAQDRERRFTFVSHGHGGREAGEFLGLRDEDVLPPGPALERIVAMKERVLASNETEQLTELVPVGKSRETWLRLRIEPLMEGGRSVGIIGTAVDISADKRNEEQLESVSAALRTTLQRFQVALRGAEITVFSQDAELRHTWSSAALGGRSPETLVGLRDEDIFPPEVARRLTEFKRGVLQSGEPGRGEFRLEEDGGERWIQLRTEPLKDLDGSLAGLVGAAVDVTERRQRETHIRILLRELTHRTKNMLAVIQAMARQTLTTSISARDFEQRFSGRLQGLAHSLDILVDENWQGASIGELIRSQLGPYRDLVGSRIRLEGPDLHFEPEAAQNIGLALHELGTNSAKYGALSGPDGNVIISWGFEGHEPGRSFVFRWREHGGPAVEPPRHKGFGHAVIERLVPRALNGRSKLDFSSEGFSMELQMPADLLHEESAVPSHAAGAP